MRSISRTAAPVLTMLVAVFLLGLAAPEVQAQNERAGTSGASHLLIPLTARHASLASTTTSGLTNLNGLEALYENPAGLAVSDGTSALFSRMDYVADIGVNYFGLGQSIGDNDLAFTVTAWDFGDIPKQTEASPEISELSYTVQFITAGLSYARQITDRIAAGTTLKVINERIDDVSGTAIAFDAGMTYVVGATGLRLGVSLRNIGTDIIYDGVGLNRRVQIPGQQPDASANTLAIEASSAALPTLLNFGVAYTREIATSTTLTALGNFRSNSFDQEQFAGGLEVGFLDIVFLRGGYQMMQDMDQSFFQGGTLGAGLNLDLGGSRLAFDYAFVPTDPFSNVNFITASLTL